MADYSLARRLIAGAFPDERLVAQSPDDWRGESPLPAEVVRYYQELGPQNVTVEDYGNPIFLPSLADLWEFQAGYRFHPETKERFADWSDDWLVVAYQGGDPFIYSRSSSKILHALHGQGRWEADELFPNLAAMVTVFAIIGDVVVSAGEDLVDEESYLREWHVAEVKMRISQVLGSADEAEVVMSSLGWAGRS